MTIRYCDFINGNDSTGDGSRTNPYKTIDKATTGATGGDEARCAKSPDHIALSGMLAWVNNSATVNTSVDLTGVLAAKDYVRKVTQQADDYNVWWEISSITSSAITLRQSFIGVTETVASQKAGVTDTGAAAAQGTNIQSLQSSGSSLASKIIISGGWDLSQDPPVQNGRTIFWQSGANWYGTGLNSSVGSRSYVTLSRLGFFRYYVGINWNSGNPAGITFSEVLSITSIGSHQTMFGYPYDFEMRDCGFMITSSAYNAINCSGGQSGLGTFVNVDIIYAKVQWLGIAYLDNVRMRGSFLTHGNFCTCVNCKLDAIASGSGTAMTVATGSKYYNCTFSSWTLAAKWTNWVEESPYGMFKDYNGTPGDDRAYYQYGYVKKNTADARSGSCVEIFPSDTAYPVQVIFNLAVDAGVDRTVTVYMKKSADFDGTVKAALFWKGVLIDGWDSLSLSTSYQQFTLVGPAANIDEDGVLELRMRVLKGTAGSVFLDDLA
jgi:hypothetical protein